MSADPLKTLFHPFEAGALELPVQGSRGLFLDAEPGFVLPGDFAAGLTLCQSFRPHVLPLERSGFSVSPTPTGENFDLALVLAGRHRGRNELNIAEALGRVLPGGLVVIAGTNESGIASLRKTVGALLPVEGSLSKFHGVVFWFRRPTAGVAEAAAEALRAANPMVLVEGRYVTRPGTFSHGRIDPGSRLLAGHLPPDLAGDVADFCAGWGFLAAEAVARCPGIARLDLYEADWEALQAARENLAPASRADPNAPPEDQEASDADAARPPYAREGSGREAPPATAFFWHDLASEPVARRYHAVLLNPPFHTGRAAEPELGKALITAAARALRPGGRLFMVANRQLPYERTLAASFAAVRELANEGGFKVLCARR